MTDETSRDSLARNRALAKMLELAREIVADDVVAVEEAEAFEKWVTNHPDLVGVWPSREVVWRVRKLIGDGKLSPKEHDELLELLRELAP